MGLTTGLENGLTRVLYLFFSFSSVSTLVFLIIWSFLLFRTLAWLGVRFCISFTSLLFTLYCIFPLGGYIGAYGVYRGLCLGLVGVRFFFSSLETSMPWLHA